MDKNVILHIMLQVNSFADLNDICKVSSDYRNVCIEHKKELIANILFKRFGNNVFNQGVYYNFGDDIEILQHLSRKGIDLNNETDNLTVLLRQAISLSYVNIVGYLLESGFATDINMIWKEACRSGALNIVEYVHTRHSNLDLDEGLSQACVFGHLETIQYLIENGADVHVHEDTPLMIAIDQGHLNVVQYLLSRGADANAQGGETILTSITALNNVEMLEAIVNAGGDIHVNNEEPLLLAVEQEDVELVEFLLTRGSVITDEIRQAALNTGNEEIISSLGM